MKIGIVAFPGSNCDHDAYHVCKNIMNFDTSMLWHKDSAIPDGIDLIILPGGFSYGDYLRSGAIARFSPIMKEVIHFANRGGYVFGICNGFQILTEAGLLPGTLMRNQHLSFVCKDVHLKVMNNKCIFTSDINIGDLLKIPIAHGDGNYFADPDTLKELEDDGSIIFKYCNQAGEISEAANPNGSISNIAGIVNKSRNVLGMMPHPERYSESSLGCDDGKLIFQSILKSFN